MGKYIDEIDKRLIQLLEEGGVVSGEKVCKTLGMTRAAVWKRVERLRAQGYPIASAPHKGYWLAGDVLTQEAVAQGLTTVWAGRALRVLQKVDSTFSAMRQWEAEGAPHGAVVASGEQSAGRGRLGRGWVSPPGTGLYFNLLLRPALSPALSARLTCAIAVGVAQGLRALGVEAGIKWPNDVVADGRKLCGILLEMSGDMDNLRFISAGIGINVLHRLEDFPEQLRQKAGSLNMLLKQPPTRARTLSVVLNQIEPAVEQCLNDYGGLLARYRALSVTLGRQIVASGGAQAAGLAEDVNENGELLIRDAAGALHTLRTGDVSVRGVMGYV